MAAPVKTAAAYWRAEVFVMPRRIGGGAGRTGGAGWELAEPRRVRAASAFAQGRPSLLRGARPAGGAPPAPPPPPPPPAPPARPLRPADDDVVVPSARRSRIAALAARPELLALLALAAVL